MCSNILIQRAAEKTGIVFINLNNISTFEENDVSLTVPDVNQISLYTRWESV